jgi:hypothetical protein
MGMTDAAPTREDLEAMDREDLKALLDERGVEYSPHAHTSTLVDLAAGDEPQTESEGQVEAREGELDEPPPPMDAYYPPTVFSPWELPARTGAAQQFIAQGVLVDESLVPEDDRLAAANNEIELYGHPEDPRLTGGSLLESPLSLEQLAHPPAVELEEPEPEDMETRYLTVGQLAEREEGGEVESEAEKEEANA